MTRPVRICHLTEHVAALVLRSSLTIDSEHRYGIHPVIAWFMPLLAAVMPFAARLRNIA